MSDLQGTHDLKRCILTVAGRRITGFGESDGVSLTRDEQRYTKKYGADGPVSRSRTNAKGGTVTITIKQTNIAMIAYLDAIGRREAPLDIVPITFASLDSGEAWVASQCWLQKETDKSWGKEDGDYVYVFDTGTIQDA